MIDEKNFKQSHQYENIHCMLIFEREKDNTEYCPCGVSHCAECHVYKALKRGRILEQLKDILKQRADDNLLQDHYGTCRHNEDKAILHMIQRMEKS